MHISGSVLPNFSTSLQWGLVLADEDAILRVPMYGCPRRFNGASSSRTGMHRGAIEKLIKLAPLQWGLVLADEDASLPRLQPGELGRLQWGLVLADEDALCQRPPETSMVRLQWGLVLADEDAGCPRDANLPRCGGFNGASSSRTRMLVETKGKAPMVMSASMGPRPRGRGCGTRCLR